MTSTDYGVAASHPRPWALRAAIDRAKRHPVLIAAAVVVLCGGGTAGGIVASSSVSAVRPAAACRAPGPPYYAYAVPPDPAHVPGAGSGPTSWGWQPHIHPLKAGNWVRGMDGQMWKVTRIVTMPGVEPVCRPFGIVGLGSASSPFNKGLIMAGRLVLQPVG
ncbi:MAG TPA: hypothetical protein VJ814_00370 [Gaiellaceae bacterium]|nr:hypothetical protein [Gaiellaceae bacterium]